MSAQKETADKLEIADKESIDAELAVGALKRRVALLEEEAARNKAKPVVSDWDKRKRIRKYLLTHTASN